MPVVRIPTPLRSHTGGKDSVEAPGSTVGEVLSAVVTAHPELKDRLFENDEVLDAAKNTLTIALTSTLLSTLIGTLAALALQRYDFPVKTFSEAALYIPIVIPEISRACTPRSQRCSTWRRMKSGAPRASISRWQITCSAIGSAPRPLPFVSVMRSSTRGSSRSTPALSA